MSSDPFTQTAKSGGTGDFEIPPAETLPAVLIGLVDLGTQEHAYGDQVERKRKVYLVWELTSEKKSGSTQNHVIARDYTLSLDAKAHLRAVADALRGKPLADGESINLRKMLGRPCLVAVEHGKTGKGRDFARVKSVAQPVRGMAVPPAQNAPYLWLFGGECGPFEAPPWLPFLYGRPVADVLRDADEAKGGGAKGDADEGGGREMVETATEEEIPF